MKQIEPGTPFDIEYGNGHRLTVVSLNIRQRMRALRLMESMQRASESPSKTIEALEELLAMVQVCSPSLTDEQIDSLDDQQMTEIVAATVMKSRLEEETVKKSESQPCSSAASSAEAAPPSA